MNNEVKSNERLSKKVAIVASYGPSLINFRGELIRGMCAAGHEVHCLAPEFDRETVEALRAFGAATMTYPLARTGTNPLDDLKTLKSLTQIFGTLKPDVVMGYTPKPAIYSTIAGYRAGASHVVPMLTGLGYAFLEGGGKRSTLIRKSSEFLYRRAFKRANGVIFHNEDDYEHLRSFGIIPPTLPVHVVQGSGVDIEQFPFTPLPPMTDEIIFLMIARLVKYKGVREYCMAASAIKREYPNTRWLLAGPEEEGPAGFPVETLNSFGGAVEYLGPVSDVQSLYAQGSHVFVLPSYGEGMPRTVLEAMSTGRPIITTDARGCRNTVDEVVNGRLVPIREWQPLADAMEFYIKHPDLMASMGRASRQKVERNYDLRLVNRDMMRILGLDRCDRKNADHSQRMNAHEEI